ncbi:hypothetical protein CYLTODRAFT_105502 [Cylindrobasidium torrendii FP15055 ss-10]|uniref:Uncharacterized protein n=1 Tax=Cylindrobasidium torrendii FP15055 ss-10 TaxID=1314674 RepID=A0A0D7B2G0_9AGAR|nr:hypothetical protein CYLTODRAFT_105502 [Cylindrobasidium torrendii FP15055 ss-10]
MGNISKTRIPARLEMSDTSKVQAAAPSIVDPDENPEAVVFNNLLGSDVSATVSGASVASFAGDVSDNDKGAVNLSMLFAWRAVLASGPTGFSKEAASNTYRDALITLGWPIPPMTISKVSNKDLQGRCDKVVLGLMQGFMDASTLKHFSHVFESIGNDSDKGAGSVFNSGVKNGPGSGSFSTGSVMYVLRPSSSFPPSSSIIPGRGR